MRYSTGQIVLGMMVLLILSVCVEGADRLNAMRGLYAGPEVTCRERMNGYRGRAAVDRIVGPVRQQAYVFNYEQLAANYGFTADFQLRQEQVILCPQTADYLYHEFTPLTLRYRRGQRPALEAVVESVTGNLSSDQEKALALMRYCRDLKKKVTVPMGAGYIYGGTEEYLIEHGTDLCEVLGRLYVGLCEIAGIPARIVMHDIGGHITAEAYLDGHWGYIDPKLGLYFRKADGVLASVWELWLNPSLLRDQSDEVKADIGGSLSWDQRIEKCENLYFHLQEINGFENYSLMDSACYAYSTLSWEEAVANGLFRINEVYNAAADLVFGLKTEDAYFNATGDSEKQTFSEQHYKVNLPSYLPDIVPGSGTGSSFTAIRSFRLRIDNPPLKSPSQGRKPQAELRFCVRALEVWEKIEVYVNSHGPEVLSGNHLQEHLSSKADLNHKTAWATSCPPYPSIGSDRRREYCLGLDPNGFWLGENIIRIVYTTEKPESSAAVQFYCMELVIR